MADWPDSWSVVTLGEAAHWWSGGTPLTTQPEFWGGGIPWITSGSLTEFKLRRSDRTLTDEGVEHGSRMVPAGTTLFVVRGMSLKTEFRIGITTRPMAFGQDCKALRPRRPDLDELFLAYAIKAQSPHILDLVDEAGHGTGRLNTDQMKGIVLGVPPVQEQRAIVEVLGALDDKIEANQHLSGLLESRLAALFLAEGFDTVDDKGAKNIRLDELLEVNPARPRPPTDAAPYLDMGALPVDSALVAAVGVRPPRSGVRFMNEDVLMARITPCLENGKVAYVDCLRDGEVGVGSTEFIVLHGRDGIPTTWAYFLARSSRFRDSAVRHMSGSSGRQRCPADAVAGYALRRPEEDSLKKFGQEAESAFPMMRAALNESLSLKALRNTLLPKLLSGELRVRDAETLVEEAV